MSKLEALAEKVHLDALQQKSTLAVSRPTVQTEAPENASELDPAAGGLGWI